jgi:hypothetical protein
MLDCHSGWSQRFPSSAVRSSLVVGENGRPGGRASMSAFDSNVRSLTVYNDKRLFQAAAALAERLAFEVVCAAGPLARFAASTLHSCGVAFWLVRRLILSVVSSPSPRLGTTHRIGSDQCCVRAPTLCLFGDDRILRRSRRRPHTERRSRGIVAVVGHRKCITYDRL